MQVGSGKNLEERLIEHGKSLLDPPTSRDELMNLIDTIEGLLIMVEQSPTKSMQAALSPLMKALIAEELLRHSDVDVRVGIASCMNEITRISAPDAPYEDENMTALFQLIVESFENLADVCDRSYQRRAVILETVAKLRSCVVLLDLECDQMILEMFNHLFKAIRSHHEEVIVESMETIMTLILEESEEISADLIRLLLSYSRRDNEVNPAAKNLAERVIRNTSDKLKPHLALAIKSLNSSLEDYCGYVALLCSEKPMAVENSNESITKDQLEDDCAESNHQHKIPTTDRSLRLMVCNGTNETRAEVKPQAAISEKAKFIHPDDVRSTHESEDNLDPEVPGEAGGNLKYVNAKTPDGEELPCDSDTIPTGVRSSEEGKSNVVAKDSTANSASQAYANEAADVMSPSRGSTTGESPSAKKQMSDDTAFHKVSEGDNLSEAKQQKSSQIKQISEVSNKPKCLTNEVVSQRSDDGSASNSGAAIISVDQKIKTTSDQIGGGTESAIVPEVVVKKRGRGRPRLEKPKSSTFEVHGKEQSSPCSIPTSEMDDLENERTPRVSSRGRQIIETDKESKSSEYREDLIGSKIKVWWPKDQMFYEGVVSAFDSIKKKHKVLYTDGDMEVLNLQKEKWDFVRDESTSDEEQYSDSNHDAPHKRRKRKRSANSSTSKRQKLEFMRESEDKDSPIHGLKSEGN